MKVSLAWLRELVDYNLSAEDLSNKLSLSSIGVKQQTEDYLELDLTYNRGDLLSLRGVAYEVSAITDSPLRFLDQVPEDFVWVSQNLPEVSVKVDSEKLASVYCVAKIENLKVEQSNKTWVKKLSDSGIRAVNNIADVTNLVMLEYGQPMHAFDAKGVKDEAIIVRLAKKDERLTTLDGKTRDLDSSDILIADSANGLGMAGVMGGKDSEVSQTTTTILLEAAIFDPIYIRNTSKKHGLYSEASKRFQHGLSKIRLLQALDAAIRMYQDLGGKLTAINLIGDFGHPKISINLDIKKVNSLLGIKLDEQTIVKCLEKLNFSVEKTAETLKVIPPYFRFDINIEEDLIEEVARMYGYEKFEGQALNGESPEMLDQSMQNQIYQLKVALKGAGLTEVQTYSFYSSNTINNLQLSISNLIKIANPISSETEYLRDNLWPNLIEVVARNLKKGFKDIAIFEIGKVYSPPSTSRAPKGRGDLPNEKYHLAIALMNGTDNPIQELWHLIKQVMKYERKDIVEDGKAENLYDLFHPTRNITLMDLEKEIGEMAEVHPRILNKFGIEKRVAIMEIAIS